MGFLRWHQRCCTHLGSRGVASRSGALAEGQDAHWRRAGILYHREPFWQFPPVYRHHEWEQLVLQRYRWLGLHDGLGFSKLQRHLADRTEPVMTIHAGAD